MSFHTELDMSGISRAVATSLGLRQMGHGNLRMGPDTVPMSSLGMAQCRKLPPEHK
jgi:hypothetical protein